MFYQGISTSPERTTFELPKIRTTEKRTETEEIEHNKEKEVSLGTTIIGVKYKDGIILGADTRTSMGTYISNRVSNKITRLKEEVFCCRSGSAADTQAIAEVIQDIIQEEKIKYNVEHSVKEIAYLASKIVYSNTDNNITAGLIIGGVDATGPHLYSIPLGGSLIEQSYAIGGSGSIYISGICDKDFKENMTRDEAISFVTTLITHSMYRDNSSGGSIRIVIITRNNTEYQYITGDTLPIQ
ncbi:20S proteasome subunit beta 1 [Nematocida sp. AWRm80]|nr:20S proteasome subunit beta 1 [Nematocida sp. AWRm80]